MPLTRDSLKNDTFKQAMLDEAPGAITLMDPEEFEKSRRDILAKAEQAGTLWVFAYGSLIWNPIIEVAETKPARLNGYSRRFCIWAHIGRGTPEKPGLWLGLDKGGITDGLALRISPEKWDEETLILWRREMIAGVYTPAWIDLEIGGELQKCCVFLANTENDRYAENISYKDTITAIKTGLGSMGSCTSYLKSLSDNLKASGFNDPYLDDVSRSVFDT